MKVSRSSLLSYQIPDNLWFLDRNETKVIDDKEFKYIKDNKEYLFVDYIASI